MIISASRRTDIPAFYAEWFINRIRAGFCTVPNPFNLSQVRRVSLLPDDVDVIAFWTRNPQPLFPYLDELDSRGYRYYFQYSILDYPRSIDAKTPSLEAALVPFRQLAQRVSPRRVIWRYDPLVFSQATTPNYHREKYLAIAQALRGYTYRSVISVLDVYPKIRGRLEEMSAHGAALLPFNGTEPWFQGLVRDLVDIASDNDMQVFSCAEKIDLEMLGVKLGKCIDNDFILETFGVEVTSIKDPGQRKACGCVLSRDIGMYNSCLYGCQYCFATSSFERAVKNYAGHDPHLPSLLGSYEQS